MATIYSSNDFNDIMDSLVLFMKGQDEFSDMNFDGSGIREILRILAYNAQNQAFQNNFVYNELQIDSAQLRANIASIADKLGYVPSSARSARTRVSIQIVPSDPDVAANTLTLTRDHQFYSNKDGRTFILSPATEYNTNLVNGMYNFEDVTLLQGTWTINGFLVNKPDDKFVIPNTGIDTNSLEVAVRASESSTTQTSYAPFTTAYDLGMDANLYFLKENRQGFYEFRFGDGKLANSVSANNVVTVRYLLTEGESGNGLTLISPATAIGGFYDIRITNLIDRTYGGSDVETIESIRTLAPISFATSGNAVTPGDYITLTKKLFSETKDVISWGGEDNVPPVYGDVFISVIPKNTETLSDGQKNDLVNILKQYNVGSITPKIVDPIYTFVSVNTKVRYVPDTIRISELALKQKISDYINLFSKDKMEKFGGSLDMSRLSEFINNIDGSIRGNYTTVSYEKHFKPVTGVLGAYVIDFSHKIMPNSLKVSGFTMVDVGFESWTYSLEDDGLGVINMHRRLGNQNVIIYKNLGTVNYQTGYASINDFNPKTLINGQYVSITSYSSVEDDQSLIGVRNSILKISNVTSEMQKVN